MGGNRRGEARRKGGKQESQGGGNFRENLATFHYISQ